MKALLAIVMFLSGCSSTPKDTGEDDKTKCIQVYKEGELFKYRYIDCESLLNQPQEN